MPLLLVTFSPAIGAGLLAVLLALFPRQKSPWLIRWVTVIPAFAFIYLLTLVGSPEPVAVSLQWAPSLGVALSFMADGLGLLFALIISGIGTLVLLYAIGYFDEVGDYARFCTYVLIFMTSMLGIVLSSNLLVMFIFWELTSVMSFLLIGFKHGKQSARDGAIQALIVTASGGLALLAGIVLIGIAAGTFDLPTLLSAGDVLRNSPLYVPALALIAVAAFTKSAQWPFHFWLPGAMEAPTPVSAYLHSATMVKAGVFLLARLSVVLNGTDLWLYGITLFGLITFLYAALIALRQTDLKAILAYSTVSWLGILVALQGSGSKEGAKALAVGVLAHALYKGALFLVAGSVDHATGERDITRLGQLARLMPVTTVVAGIAALSMAGIPPLMGFLAKETLKVAALYEGLPAPLTVLWPVAAVLGSALTVTVALRVFGDTFFGSRAAETPHHPHEVSPTMWLGGLTLGVLTVGLPWLLPVLVDPLVGSAVSAVTGTATEIHLHLFEGINLPLLLSAVAIAIGIGTFLKREPVIAWLQAHRELNPAALYRWLFFKALPDGAKWLTYHLQSGTLRHYILIVAITFITLAISTTILGSTGQLNFIQDTAFVGLEWQEVLIFLVVITGAIAMTVMPTRLSAIVVMGIIGALIALLFAWFGAPDLAFTQLMIDLIAVVLFVLAFHFLPDFFQWPPTRFQRLRDIGVAAAVGLTITVLILVTHANPVASSINPWYLEHAYSIGHGRNVVNVILVDFRGLDTQGEIVVLVIAAMGIAALLHLRPPDQPRGKHLQEVPETPEVEQPAMAEAVLPGGGGGNPAGADAARSEETAEEVTS